MKVAIGFWWKTCNYFFVFALFKIFFYDLFSGAHIRHCGAR